MSGPIWMQNTNWRDTGRHVKFFMFDGRLMLFILVLLLFPSKITLYIVLAAMTFFWGLDYYGYSLPNAWRKMFSFISGNHKSGVHYWRQKKIIS